LIPLLTLLGIELYIRRFDGWGAWGAAPLLLVPALISIPLVTLGAGYCVAAARARAPLLSSGLYTLIAALPIAWLLVRRNFV
jgi:hypothetical protein